jgi:hypothetical protein
LEGKLTVKRERPGVSLGKYFNAQEKYIKYIECKGGK